MKRLLSLAACIMIAVLSYAHDFVVDDIYYDITSSSEPYTVAVTFKGTTSYSNEYTGEITIPEAVTYNGTTYSVTNIGDYAFDGCTGLTSITIPESVTSIGEFAFSGCSGLTSVTIPESVTSIDGYAFARCGGLTSITIPNSVTSIGDYAFDGCTGLTSITIPESVTSIGGYAFAWCGGLTSITIPNSVTSIGYYAFNYCSGLTSVTIPNSVTSIGYGAFYGCFSLTSIVVEEGNSYYDSRNNCNAIIETASNTLIAGCQNTVIPEGVTSIGGFAFVSCGGLTSITIPNSVTSIGEFAFSDCSGLTSVTIPNSVTSIGNGAFCDCFSLTSVTIPEGVTSIGNSAFALCGGLTSVTIPESVTSIGNSAFASCGGLTSIVVEESNSYYDSRNNCNAIIETASNTLIVGCQNTVIPEGVTSIGNSAFASCGGLTSITIPESVTSIAMYAFYGCSALTSIVVEESNSYYDSRNNCNAIIETASNTLIAGCQNTVIPESVTSIGYYAFASCGGLTSITIPNSVTSIGDGAFYGCEGLTSVTIPNSVTSIGNRAFASCSSLTSITSYIQEPFETGAFWYDVDKSIPLYVPAGTKEKYQQTIGWSDFTNIIELGAETLEPAEEAEEVDLSQLPEELELNGVVYNNTYYALDAENGDGADSENGCVIINSITTDEAVNSIVGKDISDESVKDAFRGIIFMVPAGSGIVSVTAETNGFKTLVVKIGSQEAQTFTLAERETVKIAYTVDKPTYVYVYAGETEAPLAKGMEGTEKEKGCVKVYSYKWESAEPTGMESFTSASSPKSEESQYYYTIDGQRITGKPTKIGIYINGGKKVVVK